MIEKIQLPSDGSGVTHPGSFMFDLLAKAEIVPAKKAILLDLLDRLVRSLFIF